MPEKRKGKPCSRCKAEDAPYTLRNHPTCEPCFARFVEDRIGKRLGNLHRDTRSLPHPHRYLAGLSYGPSSCVLAHVLDSSAKYRGSKVSSSFAFVPHMVHIDTDLSYPGRSRDAVESPAQRLLSRYREKYPNLSLECVHLSKVVAAKTVDWASLPPLGEGEDSERLSRLFDQLPSLTAKADILRLLIRHLLLHLAIEGSYTALLLGHSTTALAALTLTEVANGRGFSVPSQVNDGFQTICTYESSAGESSEDTSGQKVSRIEYPIYYPVREVYRNEIKTYLTIESSVGDLVPLEQSSAIGSGSVVSHKDLSIEEVMGRYFESVEGPYAGIVANVVRTTGKLEKASGQEFCRLCGMTLDELGDSRWAGEMGEEHVEGTWTEHQSNKLCYGCKRSLHG